MGYIKKLKNNELVGGTDKHTIYPVTSTKAVFEEVTDGDRSSFKSQETINGEHDDRIKGLENEMPDTVKSITINGGTKTYTVDDEGNVNLDVYTTESAEGQAAIAEEVGDIRSIVGTKDSPEIDTLVNRVGELETLVGGDDQGSVNQRIEAAVNALDVPTVTVTDSTGHVSVTLGETDGKIDSLAVSTDDIASAEALNTLDVYVHNIEEGNIVVKSSAPINPDTGASANTVYRVAGTTTYSDYMWNGTTMVKMAEYNVDTLESQFGYYKWETASNTISITTSNQVAGSPIGSYVLTSGGSFKIKMTNKATGACTLNMNGTGVKTLLYNGDPTDSSNTWENDEVISVYYDGTYYQASNAMGGGSAMGKKKLKGISNYLIDLSGGVGTTLPTRTQSSAFNYIIYPVKEGDVISITGRGRGSKAHTWGMVDSEDKIVQESGEDVSLLDNYVLVIPEGVAKIVLNNCISGDNSYPDYEWYYAKAGSDGAETLKNTGYLVYDIPKIALGTEYTVGTVVKTEYNQKKKINQLVSSINTTTTISEGEYKTDGTNTYKAVNAIGAYDTETSYTDGAIAIGYPTTLALQISVSTLSAGNIVVTFGSNTATVSIDGTEVDASGVAAKILAALVSASIDGWSFSLDSQDNSKIVATCGSVGNNSATAFSIADANEEVVTGVSGEKEIVWNGSRFAVKYDATTDTWATASIADIATFIGGTIDSLDTLVNEITIYDSLDNEVIREKIVSYTKVKAHYWSSKFVQASSTSNNFGEETSVGNSDYSATGFMPCKGATEVRNVYSMFSNAAKYCGLVFYDENYTPILSRVNTSTKTPARYTNKVPANAAYFRTTIYTPIDSSVSIADVYYREHISDVVDSLDSQLSSVEQRVSNIEKEISEINPYLENSELVDYSTLKTASHTAYITMTVDAVNNSVTFYCTSVGTGKRGALYLPDNMINGRQYVIEFDYESQSSKAVWFAISNSYTANSLTYYYGRNLYAYGHAKFVIDYNSSIHKLFVASSNDITAGKSLILTNLSVRQLKSFDVVNDRLDKLETPSTGIKIVGNGINVVTLTPSFSLEDYMTPSINAGQGGAIFGDYYFVGTSSGYLYIYNLASKTYIKQIALPAFPISTTHVNTMCFSNQYYAQGDAFPLLYISSGYAQERASQVYGCRIVNDGDSWSISIIHTITLANSGWTEYVIDTGNNKAWIKAGNNWYCVDEPQLSDGDTATIDITTLTPIFHVKSYGGSAQGHSFLNGKIYFPSGTGTAEGISRLYVLDTTTGDYSSIVNLYEINRGEPEHVFIYNGRLYIGYRNAVRELKCAFFSDVPNIV